MVADLVSTAGHAMKDYRFWIPAFAGMAVLYYYYSIDYSIKKLDGTGACMIPKS